MQIATCRFDFIVLNHSFVLSPPPCKSANTRSASPSLKKKKSRSNYVKVSERKNMNDSLSMVESKVERREGKKM